MQKKYILEIKIEPINDDSYYCHKCFKEETIALREGIEIFRNIDIVDISYYEFTITETIKDLVITHEFKKSLYDLLLTKVGGRKTYYDYNGNLICIEKLNSDHFESFSFKSLLGYHSNKFKIGDKVKFKYANNNCEGIIVDKYIPDANSIYESENPYFYKEGYNIEYTLNGYIYCNENWQEPYYDEDLELIKEK